LARLMNRFPAIVWIGGGVLGYVAGEMILGDPTVGRWLELPGPVASLAAAALAGALRAPGGRFAPRGPGAAPGGPGGRGAAPAGPAPAPRRSVEREPVAVGRHHGLPAELFPDPASQRLGRRGLPVDDEDAARARGGAPEPGHQPIRVGVGRQAVDRLH